MKRAVVYRCYAADGAVLYIGCTTDIDQRLKSHRWEKSWWPEVASVESESFATVYVALLMETQLIAELQPVHNMLDNPAWMQAKNRAMRTTKRAVA